VTADLAAARLKSLTELGRRQGTMEGWIFFRSAGGRFWPLTAAPGTARRGSYWVKTGHGSQ
jgi:hypothetical protein